MSAQTLAKFKVGPDPYKASCPPRPLQSLKSAQTLTQLNFSTDSWHLEPLQSLMSAQTLTKFKVGPDPYKASCQPRPLQSLMSAQTLIKLNVSTDSWYLTLTKLKVSTDSYKA